MAEAVSARLGIQVDAGVVPGNPMSQYSRQWFISSSEWAEAREDLTGMEQAKLLADVNGKAQAWAMYLMLQPDRVNWVKTEWVWF